jgi:hypothetical protein
MLLNVRYSSKLATNQQKFKIVKQNIFDLGFILYIVLGNEPKNGFIVRGIL